MDFTAEHLALTLMGTAISWLVADRVATKKATDTEKLERQRLHEAHVKDLKEQLASQKESLDRYQASSEKQAADALVQERASMTVILAMGDKFANLTSEVRQTLNTFLSSRS